MVKKHIPFHKHQVPDHDEMLAKWHGCKTNIHWIKELAERWGNLTWGGDLLTLSNVSRTKANSTELITVNNDSKETQQDWNPLLWETNILDSSTCHFAIPTCLTFLSLFQKLANFGFLHVTLPSLPEMEFCYILPPQIMVFPATRFNFTARISKLFKTIILMLHFCLF